jgi:dipeptidyl aminopeptidase/acylaminoacyl peptidase
MAEKKNLISAEDLYRIDLISTPRLSPDGQFVIYSQSRIERKTEKKYSNLWRVSTASGAPQQFTYGDQHDGQPCWSPDGHTLAFLSDRGDKEKPAQIYLISMDGGEAHKLTDIPGEIRSFDWSPDGKQLLCTVVKLDKEELERQKDETKKKLGVVRREIDRVFYKLDGYGYLPHERTHLWLVDARSGKAKQLTDHAVFDEAHPAFSPDGRWIVFISNRSENPDFHPDYIDLYVMPAAGGKLRKIETPMGEKHFPVFSPDGKWIAYFGHEGEGLDYKNESLWVVPAAGNVPARNLTAACDLHASMDAIGDCGSPEEMLPTWSADGQRLYFQVTYHGAVQLKSVKMDGSDLQDVIAQEGMVGTYQFSPDEQKLFYFFGKQDDPCQLYWLDLETKKTRPLTNVNPWLKRIDLGQVREVWYKGADKNDLQGWILTPPGFNPKKKYPAILEIHGGPQVQYSYSFMHEFYYFASHGYVVFFTNPRGGRGYGEEHTKAIYDSWGDRDYADLMAWTDLVEKEPYIDKNRIGVTGGSYGGYMTLWVVGHTTRFQAAVSQRCVSNFISMWGSSDFNWVFEQGWGGKPPFENLEHYWDRSPMKYMANVRTPTKVIHNEGDMRCPIEQSEQAFVALKRLGVPTEFVRFPDEFHGLSRTGRTDRRIERLNHILSWFEMYLKA